MKKDIKKKMMKVREGEKRLVRLLFLTVLIFFRMWLEGSGPKK